MPVCRQRAWKNIVIEYREQIKNWKQKRQEAEKKPTELRSAGEGAWEDLKAGAQLAWGPWKRRLSRPDPNSNSLDTIRLHKLEEKFP